MLAGRSTSDLLRLSADCCVVVGQSLPLPHFRYEPAPTIPDLFRVRKKRNLAADTLSGGGGTDVFIGGPGHDHIHGGLGMDLVNYQLEGGPNGIYANLAAGTITDTFGDTDTVTGIEAVLGTVHSDTFIGHDGFSIFGAGGGHDTAHMGGGIDLLAVNGMPADFTIDLSAGVVANAAAGSSVTFSGVELLTFIHGMTNVVMELIEHTGFNDFASGNLTEDLLAVDTTTGALRYWDLHLSAPVYLTTLGNREVIGIGNLNADVSDDVIYRTNTGWYGFIDANGGNNNIGFRNGQSLAAIGDINGDGRDDLIFENDATGFFSYVRGGDLASVNIGSRAGSTLVATGDFNGDGKTDLLFRNDSSGWLSYARGGDLANVNVGFRTGQEMLAVGDFDGDGRDDVLFRSTTSGWMSYAKSGNGANVNLGYRDGQELLGVGDFNGDGTTDLLFRKTSSGWLSFMEGDTGANTNIGFVNNKTLVSIGDYDGDGIDDLLFQHNTTKVVEIMSGANPSNITTLGNFNGQQILSGDFGTNMGDDIFIA